MVIKLYVSGISGNKEVKKKQQRVQMILDSKQITYEAIDITEPGKEKEKEFMQQNGKVRENLGKHPIPPQIFNDDDFCGDYEDFDMANEVDELEKFLHIANSKILDNESKQNEKTRNFNEEKISDSDSTNSTYNLYDYHTFKVKWDGVNGLQEQIIDSTTGDNEQAEEVKKSEVNGVVEEVSTSNENDSDSGPKTTVEDMSSLITEEVKNEESENIEKDLSEDRAQGIGNDEIPPAEEKGETVAENDKEVEKDEANIESDKEGEKEEASVENDKEVEKDEANIESDKEGEKEEASVENDKEVEKDEANIESDKEGEKEEAIVENDKEVEKEEAIVENDKDIEKEEELVAENSEKSEE